MNETPRGYIKLYRKQFNESDILWGDGTPFDSRSAWTWLLQACAFKDGFYHTRFRLDELKRGEFVASLRFLGEAWKWGKNRVARFLALMRKAGRIARQRAGQHGTVYLIVNYDSYQSGAPNVGTAVGTADGKLAGQRRDKVEEGKEGEASNYPPEFELLWNAYPRRRPASNKAGAFRLYESHLKSGVAYDIMFEGTKRYAASCLAEGIVGTKFVKDAKTFFGRDRHFLDEHAAQPASDIVGVGGEFSDAELRRAGIRLA